MKTAMQELLEWHRKSMRSYSETNKMIEAFFEKEKEQIIEANRQGRCNDCPFMYYDEEVEEYYNQTYNQNK